MGWLQRVDGTLTRCVDCADFLKSSRLTNEEQRLTVDSLVNRVDDREGEALAMRFLGKQMLADPYGFLSVCGDSGGGKSLLLVGLVADFCRAKREARYYTADELATALMPSGTDEAGQELFDGKSPAQVRALLQRLPVLAIDEMDKIRWSDWMVRQLGELISYRHRNAATLVTLFGMNRPPEEWPTKDGASTDAITSRLRDGRFNRPWPRDKMNKCPDSIVHYVSESGAIYAPGFFLTTLPDVRPTLERINHDRTS